MSELVRLERRDRVALIVIDNPPVNAFSHAVRAALLAAIEQADADPAIGAIVLHGAGRNFIAGADIREFDQPPREPLLNQVLMRLEACGKPVVAALHGMALGGGFETALASHYRCATRDARVGLPEIKLGLLPGAGGTQRLPRIVGVETALDMMVKGEPVGFGQVRTLGLIDHVLEGRDVAAEAVGYASRLIDEGAPVRRIRDLEIPQASDFGPEFFAGYRKRLPRASRGLEAAERIIQCVEAGLSLSFDAAVAHARKLFEECRQSTQSRALRHLFFAERGTFRPGGEVAPRVVERICIVGAGTMGSGIAVSCATSGFEVILIDAQPQALEAGRARVDSTLDAAVKKGRLEGEAAAAAKARVAATTDFQAASGADLVIEAVFENMAVKQEVFRNLDALCRPGAVLATNTSTLDVDAMAAATSRPADVIGMHFFSPANVMRLVEVVRAESSAADAIATALAVTKRLGKIGVVVGNGFGFVGNRMLYAYGRENQLMLLEGATPERIDTVLESWGMAMGPNAVGDLAGLDVGYRVRRERKDLPDDPRYYRPADLLAERGRYGQKTGWGFYRYEGEARERRPDPEVHELIRAEAARLGIVPREIDDAEIIERCIYALINEGAILLQEGIAATPDDIDVIWCNGYGFPRVRGGPIFYADTLGLRTVLEGIRRFEREQGPRYWTPAPLLVELAQQGSTFREWQATR